MSTKRGTPIRRRAFIVVICLAIVGISAYASHMYGRRNAKPRLEVADAGDLRLGEINVQERVQRTVRLRNASGHRITVAELKASCGCVSAIPATFSLEPGQSQVVELNLDFLSVTKRTDIAPAKPVAVTLYALVAPPHQSVFEWQVRGTVKSIFHSVPPAIDLQSRGALTQPIPGRFDIEFHADIDDLEVTVDDEQIRLSVDRQATGRRFSVSIEAALASYGKMERVLRMTPMVDGRRQSPIESQLFIERLPDVQAEPAFINLGLVDASQPAGTVLTLSSASDLPFQVTSSRVLSNGVAVSPEELPSFVRAEGPHKRFVFTPLATTHGTHAGRVALTIRQEDGEYKIEVPYRFHIAAASNAGHQPNDSNLQKE